MLHRDAYGPCVTSGRASDVITKIHQEPAEIEQVTASFQLDQEVDVAVRVGLTASYGSKYADVDHAVASGDLQDVIPTAM